MKNWKGFKFYFKGFLFIILERKQRANKPRYYIFDIQRKTYGSSLFPITDDSFLFDLRNMGDHHNYMIKLYDDGSYVISQVDVSELLK